MIKNNEGFGSKEILTVSIVCFILAGILLYISVKSSYQEKFRVLEHNARVFGNSATVYQIENNNDEITMSELLDNGLFARVKNPFGNEYCDIYESRVEYENDQKFVTLRCGEYLIDHQSLVDDKIKIYKVGDWMTEKKSDNLEEKTLYNYKNKGKDGFEEYHSASVFLYLFNKSVNKNYESIDQIPTDYGVYSKTLYRTKVLVKTLKNSEKKES